VTTHQYTHRPGVTSFQVSLVEGVGRYKSYVPHESRFSTDLDVMLPRASGFRNRLACALPSDQGYLWPPWLNLSFIVYRRMRAACAPRRRQPGVWYDRSSREFSRFHCTFAAVVEHHYPFSVFSRRSSHYGKAFSTGFEPPLGPLPTCLPESVGRS